MASTAARVTRCRIALTGGPGGGKTTAADLFRRELHERVILVQEAATLLYAGGFPRYQDIEARRSAQFAIYHLQRNLEDVQAARYPGRILLCDRGTVDGAAYWPGPPDEFFSELGTTLAAELGRYDAVLFFETAAASNLSIQGGNPTRIETNAEAVALDLALRALWSRHPRFTLVQNTPSFFSKMAAGLGELQHLVARLNGQE